jgi:hypothetical protein
LVSDRKDREDVSCEKKEIDKGLSREKQVLLGLGFLLEEFVLNIYNSSPQDPRRRPDQDQLSVLQVT